jgi:hypothetical protein
MARADAGPTQGIPGRDPPRCYAMAALGGAVVGTAIRPEMAEPERNEGHSRRHSSRCRHPVGLFLRLNTRRRQLTKALQAGRVLLCSRPAAQSCGCTVLTTTLAA